jgi:rhizosphere induced protein
MFNLPIPPMPLPGMGLTTPIALPVGTVVAFAGKIASFPSEAPSDYTTNIEALGWMVCDGRACKISEYPELFAVLGYLYGKENDKFKIPDYRGLFLRGVDGGAKNDPEASSRELPDGTGTKGDEVGSRQEDALKAHQHTYKVLQAVVLSEQGKATGASSISTEDTEDTVEPIKPKESISINETRPKNVSVNYIIKYTNG